MIIHYFSCDPETKIYYAGCYINGERKVRAVWEQNGQYYVISGSKIGKDFQRHDFSFKQSAVFHAFLKNGGYMSEFSPEGF